MKDLGMINVFGKEIRNLVLILAVFDSSFIIRYIVNTTIKVSINSWFEPEIVCLDSNGHKHICNPYQWVIFDLITQYFWDYIPIMAILLFHKINFTSKDVVRLESMDSKNQTMHINNSFSTLTCEHFRTQPHAHNV